MSRGKVLTEVEKAQILAFKDAGLSAGAISNKIKRHKSTICWFLQDPDKYSRSKRAGRKPKMSERSLRTLFSAARKGDKSAEQLRFEQNIPLSTRRAQQLLVSSNMFRYEKRCNRARTYYVNTHCKCLRKRKLCSEDLLI